MRKTTEILATSSSHKVCHVVRRFVPGQWGGVESAVFHLSEALQEKGVSAPIFSTNMFSAVGQELFRTIPVHRYPYSFPFWGLDADARHQMALKGGNPLSLGLLRGLWSEPDVSLIHTHVTLRLGGTVRTVARWRRIPYVVSIDSGYCTLPSEISEQMMKPFENKIEWGKAIGWLLGSRRTLEDADAIVCVGRDEWELMQQRYPHKRVEWIPNGVPLHFFSNGDAEVFRQAHQLGPQEKIILCVSRIDPQKNQKVLIEAFARHHAKHPEARLILVGPITVESYHQDLLRRIEELQLGQAVKIVPGYPPEDPMLAHALKAADVFVLPSTHEPFGIVVLEAWAAGTPVIASRVGGIPGFATHEENALFFESNSVDQLSAALERLTSDPDLARQIAAGGQRAVAAYDWSRVADQTLELYDALLAERRT